MSATDRAELHRRYRQGIDAHRERHGIPTTESGSA